VFKDSQGKAMFIPSKDPAEMIFERGLHSMNEFLNRVKQFESITQDSLKDLWRIRDVAF
jgi:hypothetical protein